MTDAALPRRRVLRLGRVIERTPLRAKLMAVLFVLTAAGVVATSLVASAVMRSELLDRMDATLARNSDLAVLHLTETHDQSPSATAAVPGLSAPYVLVVRDASGNAVRPELDVAVTNREALPNLSPVTPDQARALAGRAFTVPARGSSQPGWRVRVIVLPGAQTTLTLALSLDDVNRTVAQLRKILLIVGLDVLALITGLAYFMVRSGLRPLKQVGATAEAIAAGDLSRRVTDRYGRVNEVGQLAVALNGMLHRLESEIDHRETAKRAALASEEQMRRFIGDAGHELRTPLTSIRGFAELHRQAAVSDPETTADLMHRIEEEANRMGVLVEDLLLLTRLEQARPLAREPVDLRDIAADAVTAAQAANPTRPFGLLLPDWNADDRPGVIGDAACLRQVVDNLLRNACVHTPAGTVVTVRVATANEHDGRWAVLEVADAGPGLPADEQAKIFERFYRADRSRARATGGSGLGLSIVAALVAAHDGRVTVSSPPGAGAVFRVLLPLDATPRVRRSPVREPHGRGCQGGLDAQRLNADAAVARRPRVDS